jgi:RHS repeat-associated protein
MKILIRSILLMLALGLAGVTSVRAQRLDTVAEQVPVSVVLSYYQPNPSPDLWLNVNSLILTLPYIASESVSGLTYFRPGTTYTVTIGRNNVNGYMARFNVPAGYQVYVGQHRQSTIDNGSDNLSKTRDENFGTGLVTSTYEVTVVPVGLGASPGPGVCTSFQPGKIAWMVGLGQLTGGRGAGSLAIVSNDWAHLGLVYLPESTYVTDGKLVPKADGHIQFLATQCAVNIAAIDGNSYRMQFYARKQATVGGDGNLVYAGAPYVTYTVAYAVDAGTPSLTITKESRGDAAETNASASVVQTQTTDISLTSGVWKINDWHTGASPLSITTWTNNVDGSRRTQVMTRKDDAGTPAEITSRVYQTFVWGEELVELHQDPDGANLTTYYHYDDVASAYLQYNLENNPNFSRLRSVTWPDGRWQSFSHISYHSYDLVNFSYAPPVQTAPLMTSSYRPWCDDPGTAVMSGSSGDLTTYNAEQSGSSKHFGESTGTVRTINGQMVSKSVISYADSVITYADTYNTTRDATTITEENYSSASACVTTVTKLFNENPAVDYHSGKRLSVQHPDGTKEATSFEFGTLSGSTFTADYTLRGHEDVATRVTTCLGTAASSGTGACQITLTEGNDSTSVWLVPNQSTKTVVLQDKYARVVRTETWVYTSTVGYVLIDYIDYTYDLAGRLKTQTSRTGGVTTINYTGDFKTDETNELGYRTEYAPDAALRVQSETKMGDGPHLGDVTTVYAYDAVGRVKQRTVGGSLVTSFAFDAAGRPTAQTDPGNFPTGWTYSSDHLTTTVTLPGGATKIVTNYRDGQVKQVSGTATVKTGYTYAVESDGSIHSTVTQTDDKDSGNVHTRVTAEAWTDMLGRTAKTSRPGFGGTTAVELTSFGDSGSETGRPVRVQHLDGTGTSLAADTLFHYDALGRQDVTCLDMDGNQEINYNGTDRIAASTSGVEPHDGNWWAVQTTSVYAAASSDTPTVTGVTRTRLTGLGGSSHLLSETVVIDVNGTAVDSQTVGDATAKKVTTLTTTAGFSQTQTSVAINGLAVSSTGIDGLTASATYDSLWRPSTQTDTRGNKTTTTYISGTTLVDQVLDAMNVAVATYGSEGYDAAGRVIAVKNAYGKYTRTSYTAMGQVWRQWGDATYPVEYVYDGYGQRTDLFTFRGEIGWTGAAWPSNLTGAQISQTSWVFENETGLLWVKMDPSAQRTVYNYNPAGQMVFRAWARTRTNSGLDPADAERLMITRYTYDPGTGELTDVAYNDSTAGHQEPIPTAPLHYVYNRLGQITSVTDATGTRSFARTSLDPTQVDAETLDSTYYNGRVLTRLHDAITAISSPNSYANYTAAVLRGRPSGIELGVAGSTDRDLHVGHAYNDLGQFVGVNTRKAGNPARDYVYTYQTNSNLVSGYVAYGSGVDFSTVRAYEDQRNVLTSVQNYQGAATVARFDCTTDSVGRRSTVKQSGTAFADYGTDTFQAFGYNNRNELTAAIGYLGASVTNLGTPLADRRFVYDYDAIGNRKTSNYSNNAGLLETYTANVNNQYEARENYSVPVAGMTANDPAAKVVVASGGLSTGAGRQGGHWAAPALPPLASGVPVNNAGPAKFTATVLASAPGAGTGGADIIKSTSLVLAIPPVAQGFSYDADGNMTGDSLWKYTYDGENRLIVIERPSSLGSGSGFAQLKLVFTYDYLGRRVEKKVYDLAVSSSTPSSVRRYVYDGWNLVAEIDGSGALQRTYTWGLDGAGSLTASGGAGALLQITTVSGTTPTDYFVASDGGGNVAAILATSDGAVKAAYEYSPYGEALRAETPAGDAAMADNPFRFSGKYTDTETGLVYYGYRYYSPVLGRFITRDPSGESGGLNLYGFVANHPSYAVDTLGLYDNLDFRDTASYHDYLDDSGLTEKGRHYSWMHAMQYVEAVTGATNWYDDLDASVNARQLKLLVTGTDAQKSAAKRWLGAQGGDGAYNFSINGHDFVVTNTGQLDSLPDAPKSASPGEQLEKSSFDGEASFKAGHFTTDELKAAIAIAKRDEPGFMSYVLDHAKLFVYGNGYAPPGQGLIDTSKMGGFSLIGPGEVYINMDYSITSSQFSGSREQFLASVILHEAMHVYYYQRGDYFQEGANRAWAEASIRYWIETWAVKNKIPTVTPGSRVNGIPEYKKIFDAVVYRDKYPRDELNWKPGPK